MVRPLAGLYARVRHLVPELAKFGIVGGIGTIIDLGGAAVLHSAYHEGPLESKAISITAATVFTYLGSRFWTFRHRENQPVHREAVLFIVLNIVGLVIAEAVIALITYGLGLKDPLAYNGASLVGTGLGTIFRFYAYRKWVFLAPAEEPAPVAGAADADFPYHAPWELDPAYLDPAYSVRPVEHPRRARLGNPVIPNVRVAPPLVAAAVPTGPPAYPASSPGRAPMMPAPMRPAPARPVPAGHAPAGHAPAGPAPAPPRTPGRHRKTR